MRTEFDSRYSISRWGDWSGYRSAFFNEGNHPYCCSPALIAAATAPSPRTNQPHAAAAKQTNPPLCLAPGGSLHSTWRIAHDLNVRRPGAVLACWPSGHATVMGVALIPPFLIRDELDSGRLSRPAPQFESDSRPNQSGHSGAKGRIRDVTGVQIGLCRSRAISRWLTT